MGHHSDPEVAQPISADQALAAKLAEIQGSLTAQLTTDFAKLTGVPLPGPGVAALEQTALDLVAVTTPLSQVIGDYQSGAQQLIGQGPLPPQVRALAGDVLAGLMSFVSTAGGIQTGGYASSAVDADASPAWCCAVFCEVDYGSASTWATPVDFHIILYAFVIWSFNQSAAELDDTPRPVSPRRWAR